MYYVNMKKIYKNIKIIYCIYIYIYIYIINIESGTISNYFKDCKTCEPPYRKDRCTCMCPVTAAEQVGLLDWYIYRFCQLLEHYRHMLRLK